MINYYEYETSPRKEEEYIKRRPKKKTNVVKTTNDIKKKARKAQAVQSKKNIKTIIEIGIGFILLLTISYRYALINSRFSEKEGLKATLSNIQKQNAQLKVNIEQGMNISNIEQAAKEKLGMQKLDNNQKVYLNLHKKDYTESSTTTNSEDNSETENWWDQLVKTLKNE